tara:strand:- start:7291 stop:8469 length:1179 start_codon:yes stop_codon:yes gene_type:complete
MDTVNHLQEYITFLEKYPSICRVNLKTLQTGGSEQDIINNTLALSVITAAEEAKKAKEKAKAEIINNINEYTSANIPDEFTGILRIDNEISGTYVYTGIRGDGFCSIWAVLIGYSLLNRDNIIQPKNQLFKLFNCFRQDIEEDIDSNVLTKLLIDIEQQPEDLNGLITKILIPCLKCLKLIIRPAIREIFNKTVLEEYESISIEKDVALDNIKTISLGNFHSINEENIDKMIDQLKNRDTNSIDGTIHLQILSILLDINIQPFIKKTKGELISFDNDYRNRSTIYITTNGSHYNVLIKDKKDKIDELYKNKKFEYWWKHQWLDKYSKVIYGENGIKTTDYNLYDNEIKKLEKKIDKFIPIIKSQGSYQIIKFKHSGKEREQVEEGEEESKGP